MRRDEQHEGKGDRFFLPLLRLYPVFNVSSLTPQPNVDVSNAIYINDTLQKKEEEY